MTHRASCEASIAARTRREASPAYSQRFMIQQKFALPVDLPDPGADRPGARRQQPQGRQARELRARLRRHLRLLRPAVRRPALSRWAAGFSPEWAPWMPNIVMGVGGVVLLVWRAAVRRPADSPQRSRRSGGGGRARRAAPRRQDRPRPADARRARRPGPAPRPARCRGCSTSTSRASTCASSLLGVRRRCSASSTSRRSSIWPTSCFAARRPRAMLLRYFYFQTPQFVYYVIPMAVLVATLVTIGVMTKNSELLVMRACGISLYRRRGRCSSVRAAGQRVAVRAAGAGARVDQPRGRSARPRSSAAGRRAVGALDRRWMRRPRRRDLPLRRLRCRSRPRFTRLHVYRLDQAAWRLRSDDVRQRSGAASRNAGRVANGRSIWKGTNGWYARVRARRAGARRPPGRRRSGTLRGHRPARAAARVAQLLQDRATRWPT